MNLFSKFRAGTNGFSAEWYMVACNLLHYWLIRYCTDLKSEILNFIKIYLEPIPSRRHFID